MNTGTFEEGDDEVFSARVGQGQLVIWLVRKHPDQTKVIGNHKYHREALKISSKDKSLPATLS